MAGYNGFADPRNYMAVRGIESESIPSTAAFAYRPGESIAYNTEGIIKHPFNIHSLTEQPLTDLARQVLSVIATYEVVTTKQIVDVLNMLSIQTDSAHVLKAGDRLRKTGLIHMFRFASEDNASTKFIAYRLTKMAGENAAYVSGIPVGQVDHYNVVESACICKRKLAVNQVIFAYLKHCCGSVTGFEKSKRIYAKTDTTADRPSLRPSLALRFIDDSVFFYEVVRRDAEGFWCGTLRDKLLRYKFLLDNWDKNSWDWDCERPQLIVCCEDMKQSIEVEKMAKCIGMDVFYTHDLLLFGSCFNTHIYSIKSDSTPEHYQLEAEK